jgi:hypothetical protein
MPVSRRRTGHERRNPEKDRIDFREFRKKAGSVAGNFKKRPDQFLRIPEKSWLSS